MSADIAPAYEVSKAAWFEMSDLGNAKRLEMRATGRLIFVKDLGWLGYDGKSWRADDGDRLARRLAHETADGIRAEAEYLADDLMDERRGEGASEEDLEALAERAKKMFGWAVRSGDRNRTTAMLTQAEVYLAVKMETLDPEPLALNVANGVLDFKRHGPDAWDCELTPHAPERRMTKIAGVAYDKAAKCPKWLAHLETCLPDPEVRRFFQAVMGYIATGVTREQIWLMLQGKGGDGKSTTIDVIRLVLGSYGDISDIKTWLDGGMQRSGADASPDMARLAGDMRLCSTAEPPPNARLNDGLIKAVTGGAPLLARHLSQGLFSFRPRFKLVMEVNKRPRPSGDDDGFWRRVKLILFTHQFKGAQAIKDYESLLVAEEGPGILNWLLEGVRAWLNEGLRDPEAVTAAIEDFRRSTNPFGEWWMDRIDPDPDHRVRASVLYADYEEWCKSNGHEPIKQAAFGRALADRQVLFAGKDASGKVTRKGAKLRARAEAPPPNAPGYGEDPPPFDEDGSD